VRLTRRRLDRQIAAGCRCEPSPALAIRTRQLTHPRTRLRIARNLRRIVGYVDRVGLVRARSAVIIERPSVIANREAILGLADRLAGTDPVSARGVLLALALTVNGISSPLFNLACGRTVSEAIWEVADALGADAPAIGFDAVGC
jgi:hypothetical protein